MSGAKFKDRRLALGYTLRDVEAITDGEISNAYLSQFENGKIKNPSAFVIICLCAAYAIPFAEALEWLGTPVDIPPPKLCGECGRALPLRYEIDAPRDRDGTAAAAANEDLPVPKDCQARAGTASPND